MYLYLSLNQKKGAQIMSHSFKFVHLRQLKANVCVHLPLSAGKVLKDHNILSESFSLPIFIPCLHLFCDFNCVMVHLIIYLDSPFVKVRTPV